MTSHKTKKSNGLFKAALLPLIFAIAFPVFKTFQANDPLEFMLPNLLLFTNLREQTRELWHKYIKINWGTNYDYPHVPVMDAKDYTYDNMRKATENWRYPAIVRGFFNDTPAMKLWPTEDYLPSKLGKFRLPVINNAIVGKVQNDRQVMSFEDGFKNIVTNPDSRLYIFFPVKSRFSMNYSDLGAAEDLSNTLNEICLEDLELHRIWKGFGTKAHKSYFGSQMIIGQGSDDAEATTGTGWHCAVGSNWFAQVAGTKRWYFMDPKYSAYMYPLRGGRVNMMTGNRDMANIQKHLPLRYADVHAGDLLYNPDWEWHTIQNKAGLSIGIPIREVNITLSFQNNFQYTSIMLINKLLEQFGMDIGGYPQA